MCNMLSAHHGTGDFRGAGCVALAPAAACHATPQAHTPSTGEGLCTAFPRGAWRPLGSTKCASPSGDLHVRLMGFSSPLWAVRSSVVRCGTHTHGSMDKIESIDDARVSCACLSPADYMSRRCGDATSARAAPVVLVDGDHLRRGEHVAAVDGPGAHVRLGRVCDNVAVVVDVAHGRLTGLVAPHVHACGLVDDVVLEWIPGERASNHTVRLRGIERGTRRG